MSFALIFCLWTFKEHYRPKTTTYFRIKILNRNTTWQKYSFRWLTTQPIEPLGIKIKSQFRKIIPFDTQNSIINTKSLDFYFDIYWPLSFFFHHSAHCQLTSECGQDEICLAGQCINPCHQENACGMNSECLMSTHVKQCACPVGFTGNAAVECVRSELILNRS